MAQQTLQTTIVLNGQVSNTFTDLGDQLTMLGAQVDLISQKLIDFGSGSLETWQEFETNLTHISSIMSKNFGYSATQAAIAIDTLDLNMRKWAANTPFGTDDISEATENAAISGLNYLEIIDLMPAAMNLALAGEMDLSEATNMLINVMNGAGLDFSESQQTVDKWVKAADSANVTVVQLGDSMKRMGSTTQLAGSFDEVLLMLDMLADKGIKGAEAGTLLRNTLVRVLAPNAKGQETINTINKTKNALTALNEVFRKTGLEQESWMTLGVKNDFSGYEEIQAEVDRLSLLYGQYVDTLSDDEIKALYRQQWFDATNGNEEYVDKMIAEIELQEDANDQFKAGLQYLADYNIQLAAAQKTYAQLLNDEDELNNYLMDNAAWAGYWQKNHSSMSLEDYTKSVDLNERLVYAKDMLGLSSVYAYAQQAGEDGVIRAYKLPIMDFFTQLSKSFTQNYGPNWDDSAGAIRVLYDLFMSRGITGGMALAQGAQDEDYAAVYEGIINNYDGYASDYAEKVQQTYYGQKMRLESIWENFKLTIGEILAPQAEDVYDALGSVVDKINSLETSKLTALTSALEVVAAAGPALLASGAIVKLVGYMMSVPGMLTLGAIGIGTVMRYMSVLEQEQYEDSFGTMKADTETIGGYVRQLGSDFDAAYAGVNKFNTEMAGVVENYKLLSSSMSSMLLTGMLTKSQLTAEDKQKLLAYAQQMDDTLLQAIATSQGMSEAFWTAFFGEDSDNGAYNWALSLTNSIADEAIAEAQLLSINMRDALTSAFDDGEISQEEYQKILAYMRDYNDAIARAEAEAKNESDYIERQKTLAKAQNISYDDLTTLLGSAVTERDARIAEAEDYYLTQRYKLEYRARQQIDAAGTQAEKDALQAELDANIAAMDAQWEQNKQQINDTYAQFFTDLWLTGLNSNDENLPKAISDIISGFYGSKSYDDDVKLNDYLSVYKQAYTQYYHSDTRTDAEKYASKYIEVLTSALGDEEAVNIVITAKDDIDAKTKAAIARAQQVADENPVNITYGQRIGGGGSSGNEFAQGPLYAAGGRADTASVFGEAGPEWAIPEKHDANTAALLMQAAAASGFSWPELASSASASQTLVYSPTIYANDAQGLEGSLREDKDRLDKWYRRKALLDSVSAY